MTPDQALNAAIDHHRAGRFADAEQIYSKILAAQPNNAMATQLLGAVAYQTGRLDIAIDLFHRALRLNPDDADAWYTLANALRDSGRLDQAIAAYQRAIQLQPENIAACNNLGNALRDTGRLDEAIAVLQRAIQIKPHVAVSHHNLAIALEQTNQLDAAIASYRRAIELQPDYGNARLNLANVMIKKGDLNSAIDNLRQTIQRLPDFAQAHANLGSAFINARRLNDAIASLQRAIELNPTYAEAHSNLGIALREIGQLDQSITSMQRAIQLRPDLAGAHYNLSLALLARGDFQQGWEEYEWRWKYPTSQPTLSPQTFAQPLWDGTPLQARTLLIHAEQGFGDAIQFVRYLPLAVQRGGKIIFQCRPELQRLFQTIPGGCEIIARGQPLPPFDLHCPLLSLPRIFRTTLTTIPSTVPYLSPEPQLVEAWSRTLGPADRPLRIGLAWAGNPQFAMDQTRSISLQQLAAFAAVQGVKFFGLQKDPAAQHAKHPPAGLKLVDLGPQLKDFADTAAVMSLLDLIITTDTSVPHLAGALGEPVWVMLQFVPDFRWLVDRPDSPWYPSMRLFRQPAPGDWDSVIAQVVEALSLWIPNRKNKPG
jgi:tetratricopeptide (TPR) repeat protein